MDSDTKLYGEDDIKIMKRVKEARFGLWAGDLDPNWEGRRGRDWRVTLQNLARRGLVERQPRGHYVITRTGNRELALATSPLFRRQPHPRHSEAET